MSILSRFLEWKGVKPEELSAEEKATLETWRKVFLEEDVTVDKIKEWCDMQIAAIEPQFRDPTKSDREKANLTLVYSVYSSMRALIVTPRAEKENLEKHLEGLMKAGGQRT